MVSRPPTTGETTSSVSILNLIGLRARSLNIGDYIDESGNRHSAPYEKGVFCFFSSSKIRPNTMFESGVIDKAIRSRFRSKTITKILKFTKLVIHIENLYYM